MERRRALGSFVSVYPGRNTVRAVRRTIIFTILNCWIYSLSSIFRARVRIFCVRVRVLYVSILKEINEILYYLLVRAPARCMNRVFSWIYSKPVAESAPPFSKSSNIHAPPR